MNNKGFIEVVAGLLGIGAIVGLILFLSCWTTVPAGHRGVVLTWGAVTDNVGEGFHWKSPIAQRFVNFDVRTMKTEVTAEAATKDLQAVRTSIAVNTRLSPELADDMYKNLGTDYAPVLIGPVIQEAVKASTAKFTAEELITKRAEFSEAARLLIVDKLTKSGLTVEAFNVTNFKFSESFDDAIEMKVTAEQQALAQKNKLEQVKYEAEQQVVAAKAQAETIRIQAEAIQQQGGENYVNLKAIEKWNGALPAQFVPGSALPFVTLK